MVELTHADRALLHGNFERIAMELQLERRRQITEEGFNPKHDEQHGGGELAKAAAAYIAGALFGRAFAIGFWPWDPAGFKPKDPRRDLVRAGALVIAAIERLDREALAQGEVEGA